MPDEKNRQIRLARRPEGMPEESDFKLVETGLPKADEGQFLVKTLYLSVDPYMRGLLREEGSIREPVGIDEVIFGEAVGQVIESKHPQFQEGEIVVGPFGWQEWAASDGEGVDRVDPSLGPISTALGVLGMPGMTAYFGLLEIGDLRDGENVFVSGAAGAVGSLVGQIAKIKNCRVAGSAGSPRKIDWLRGELGFDEAFNYKETDDYKTKLDEVLPDGVDVYFDNVGGPLTDAVFTRLRTGARIVVCGQIDQYNATDAPQGPRKLWHLILKQARAEGFLVYAFRDRWEQGRRQMADWLRQGRIQYRETIAEGIDQAPRAFIGLFKGENIGKQVVKISEA